MEIHEAANIFPLDEDSIGELAKDIREHGQRVPVELLDGKVIDGRRRLRACELAGIKPTTKDVTTDDPIAYVVSLNLIRRHLDQSQKAMVGARATGLRQRYEDEAKSHQRMSKGRGGKGGANLPHLNGSSRAPRTRDRIAAVVGVGGRTIDSATKVLRDGIPELVAAVDAGEITVSRAVEISKSPPAVQAQRLSEPRGIHKEESEPTEGEMRGSGILRAKEAINCLIRIPKNDALRNRGFQLVKDWIRDNG